MTSIIGATLRIPFTVVPVVGLGDVIMCKSHLEVEENTPLADVLCDDFDLFLNDDEVVIFVDKGVGESSHV